MAAVHMDEIQNIIDEYFTLQDAEQDPIAFTSRIYSLVSNNSKISILTFVEALSNSLTNENVETRLKGTQLLAEYLHHCQPGDLNNQENETLMLFFCNRLNDHHSVQPLVIYGFLGLLTHQNINNELVVKMLQCIFAEVHVQSMTQSDRHNVFNLFRVLLKVKLDVLKGIAADFVLGFIQAIDGERDPRNLLVCFANSHIVLREIDTSLFIEDFFEVLSCYFPIDFTPPKDNQFAITKEDLVLSLRKCLTCCKEFAPYAIPLYIEKLSSDIVGAKLDSLLTFTQSLAIFPPPDVELFSKDIWMLIRKDFLLSEEKPELKQPYVDFIVAFVQCLMKSRDKEALFTLADQLVSDCLQTLKDPDMTIAIPCGELVQILSNLSGEIFVRILDKILLPIETALSKYSSNPQRTSVFEMVVRVLQVATTDPVPQLEAFIDKHLALMYSFLTAGASTRLQCLSLKCLTEITKRQKFFDINMDTLCQHAFNMVFSDGNLIVPNNSFAELKTLVEELSRQNPELVDKYFLSCLTNQTVSSKNSPQFPQHIKLLHSCCANFKHFGNTVLSYLGNTILQSIKHGGSNSEESNIFKETTICCSNILSGRAIDEWVDQNVILLPVIREIFLVNLQEKQKNQQDQGVFYNGLISVISRSFKRLNAGQQVDVLKMSCEVLKKRDVPGVVIWSSVANSRDETFLQVAILFCTGIISQANNVILKELETEELLTVLWDVMKEHCGNELAQEHLGMCIGSLVNKAERESTLPELSLKIVSENLGVIAQLTSASSTTPTVQAAVNLLCWLMKACVLNWRGQTNQFIRMLVECLTCKATGNQAAKGFEVLSRDETQAMTKDSNAVIKLMYKQRFSQLVLPLLVDAYNNKSEDDVKAYLITAISCTLKVMPKQLLQLHLKELMPLLMHSLVTCDSDEILYSTITTLSSVLDHNKSIVEEHVGTLASRLLSLVTHSKMNIRIVALKSLTCLSSYPSYKVVPMKANVVRTLRAVLDDSKRLVRKEAIECSNAWHLMGT